MKPIVEYINDSWFSINPIIAPFNMVILAIRIYQAIMSVVNGDKIRQPHEKYNSILDCFNPYKILFIWNYKKAVEIPKDAKKKKNDDHKEEEILYHEEDWIDIYLKVIVWYHVLHFGFHNVFTITNCGWWEVWSQPCRWWLFVHHGMSIVTFKCVWMYEHYPWYICFPLLYHSVVIWDPYIEINAWIYGVGLVIYAFYPWSKSHWRYNKIFQA